MSCSLVLRHCFLSLVPSRTCGAKQRKPNTQKIADQGAKLYDRLRECVEDFLDVGKCIERAHGSFQSAKKRLSEGRSNAIREAQILTELGIKPKKLLPTALLEGASSDDMEKT